MVNSKEIAVQLKQDISTLYEIAKMAPDADARNRADETYEMIIAGLGDYELFWRNYTREIYNG